MKDRILRLPEVIDTISMSRSWIYAAMARGEFPRPVRIGPKAVGWRRSSLEKWVEGLHRR